ncbi:hypothetical protein AAFF_G00073740, partial [Aldrovandia affinis]
MLEPGGRKGLMMKDGGDTGLRCLPCFRGGEIATQASITVSLIDWDVSQDKGFRPHSALPWGKGGFQASAKGIPLGVSQLRVHHRSTTGMYFWEPALAPSVGGLPGMANPTGTVLPGNRDNYCK